MKNTIRTMALVAMLTVLALTGCTIPEDSNKQVAKQTEVLMQEANNQIGMPAIVNFQEKKLAKMIFELRDKENLITYAYIVNHMTGELVFIGECVGYGLPYSVQYTNPMKHEGYTNEGFTLPQADPNGLFMPDGLSATWLMLIDPETGDPRPVYVEPEILISPFKLN